MHVSHCANLVLDLNLLAPFCPGISRFLAALSFSAVCKQPHNHHGATPQTERHLTFLDDDFLTRPDGRVHVWVPSNQQGVRARVQVTMAHRPTLLAGS
jgi:hypothetical protein